MPFRDVPGLSIIFSDSSNTVAKVSLRSTIVAFAEALSHFPNSSKSSCRKYQRYLRHEMCPIVQCEAQRMCALRDIHIPASEGPLWHAFHVC